MLTLYLVTKLGGEEMSSCESRRTRAYHDDLRWKAVWQGEALGYSHDKIARNLSVDRSTVSRILMQQV